MEIRLTEFNSKLAGVLDFLKPTSISWRRLSSHQTPKLSTALRHILPRGSQHLQSGQKTSVASVLEGSH